MTVDLLAEYEATLSKLLCLAEDHHERADLCGRVLAGETWDQVFGGRGREPYTYSHLVALKQLDESIQRAGGRPEQNAIIERLQEKMRKDSLERDRVVKETEPLNLPAQQQIPAQASPKLAGGVARPLGTQIRIPVRLVKCQIPISSAFSGNQLACAWGDLLWATVSVGRPGLTHILQHGVFSWYEMAYRLCMVEANLDLAPSAELVKVSAFTALDPSEKNAISYFFGLSFVKLFAELALDVPWLLHVDRYRVALGVTTSATTNVRPDLLGCDIGGDWLAFEAKGRSGAFSTSPIAKGKYQLAQLLQVQSKSPKMRLVAQTYFNADKLTFHCEDPDAGLGGYGIDIPDDAYFGQYYEPILDMLDRLSSPTSLVDFAGMGISIGLDPDVHRMVRAKDWEGVKRWAAKSKHQSTDDLIVGRDGLMVRSLRTRASETL